MPTECFQLPTAEISAKSADSLPSYGHFARFVLYIPKVTFGKVCKNRSPTSRLPVDRFGWKFGYGLFETFYYDLTKQIFALSQLLLCCPTLMAVSKKRGSTMEFHIFSKNVLWSWSDNQTFLVKLSSNKVYMIPYKAQVSNPSGWGDTALPCPNLLSVYSTGDGVTDSLPHFAVKGRK